MLNGDGGELRQRAATTSLPGKITEETATQHRMRMEKMREEDMQPVSWKAGVVVIILLMICCALGWHLILAHADHWIIDEINNGHVENVRAFLKDHEIHHINKLDNVSLVLYDTLLNERLSAGTCSSPAAHYALLACVFSPHGLAFRAHDALIPFLFCCITL
jgi:hypothetical protein